MTAKRSRGEVFVKGYGRSEVYLDNFESLSNPGFLTLDAGLKMVLGYGVSASLVGRNLMDHRRRVDALQAPLPGLSVYGQLTYDHVFGNEEGLQEKASRREEEGSECG